MQNGSRRTGRNESIICWSEIKWREIFPTQRLPSIFCLCEMESAHIECIFLCDVEMLLWFEGWDVCACGFWWRMTWARQIVMENEASIIALVYFFVCFAFWEIQSYRIFGFLASCFHHDQHASVGKICFTSLPAENIYCLFSGGLDDSSVEDWNACHTTRDQGGLPPTTRCRFIVLYWWQTLTIQ